MILGMVAWRQEAAELSVQTYSLQDNKRTFLGHGEDPPEEAMSSQLERDI